MKRSLCAPYENYISTLARCDERRAEEDSKRLVIQTKHTIAGERRAKLDPQVTV